MEEFTIELDDETFAWIEFTAAERKKTISEVIGELIAEIRGSHRTSERNPD